MHRKDLSSRPIELHPVTSFMHPTSASGGSSLRLTSLNPGVPHGTFRELGEWVYQASSVSGKAEVWFNFGHDCPRPVVVASQHCEESAPIRRGATKWLIDSQLGVLSDCGSLSTIFVERHQRRTRLDVARRVRPQRILQFDLLPSSLHENFAGLDRIHGGFRCKHPILFRRRKR